MKKTLFILTAILLLFVLAACGGTEEPTVVPLAELPTAVSESVTVDTNVTINDIENIVWQWEAFQDTAGVNDITVPDPTQYTLTLRPDGTAPIQADCNQVQWTYTSEGNSLSFNTLGPSTLAFCGEESLDQEYLTKLGAAGTFVMSEGKLIINLMADAGNMVFINSGPAPEQGGETLPADSFCDVIHPASFSLNTFGLNYSWQANCVAETPYDQSQPPGPKGMPEHIEINFGITNPADKQPGDPVIYIIPADTYKAMWEANGNDSVTRAMDAQQAALAAQEIPFPPFSVLPTEEIGGVNDLSVQQEYLNFGDWGGLRFVGRYAQDANPVMNQNLRYIFQGYAGEDDPFFVAMFWPVSTPFLPADGGEISQEEFDRFSADNQAYMDERTTFLNGLAPTDWVPPLTILDALLGSLEYSPSQSPDPVPTAEIPTPESDAAYGVVTAPSGVYVRTGPGSAYPIISTASFGTEGAIIGKSADGEWWVSPVQGAPNNQGWVSATYVQAFNAENVPVIQAPPPPIPTATPTPLPTPAPSINFWADRTTINQGDCTTLRWDVNNIQAVWVYPQGKDYAKYPTTGQGSQQVCPPQTTTYEMRVQNTDGSVEFRQLIITVNENNPLINTSWTLQVMNETGVMVPGTTLTLNFGSGGYLSGNGGCNNFSGNYIVSGANISISSLVSSKMACGADIDQQESLYLQLLGVAATYELSGSQLILRNVNGAEILRYNRS